MEREQNTLELLLEASSHYGCSSSGVNATLFVKFLQQKYHIKKEGYLSANRFNKYWLKNSLVSEILPEIFEMLPSAVVAVTKQKKGQPNILDEIGRNLSKEAQKGAFDHYIYREEIAYLHAILSKKSNLANALIIGESRSGKSALVRVYSKLHPEKTIYEVIAHDLLAETELRGQLEGKIKKIISSANPENIIFFDEAQYLLNDSNQSTRDIANALKSALSDNHRLKCIFATTPDEISAFSGNKALINRFQKIYLKPMDRNQILPAINATVKYLSELHNKTISKEVVFTAYNLVQQVYPERVLDSFKNTLDLALALTREDKISINEIVKVLSMDTGRNPEEIFNLI